MFDPFTLIYLMVPLVTGLLLGYSLRNKNLPRLDKFSLAVIIVLIFSLGFGIGSNNELIAALPEVGAQALIIATMAILLSIVFLKAGKKLEHEQ